MANRIYAPVVGAGPLPAIKEGGRADFQKLNTEGDSAFDLLIETKTPRYAWSRSALCPCLGPNAQTTQPDPQCELCKGNGWLPFRPVGYAVDEAKVGELSPLQNAIVESTQAVVIRALVVGASAEPNIFAVLGKWALGSASVTVRAGNRLGYYDRLVALEPEETIPYCEVLTVGSSTPDLRLRYHVVGLNLVRSVDTVYSQADFTLSEDGRTLAWRVGRIPVSGTRVVVHYLAHPTWVVQEYSKVNRVSVTALKLRKRRDSPPGDIIRLPAQYIARLEHLAPME